MLHPTLTRYHVTATIAVIAAVFSFWWAGVWAAVSIILIFGGVFGLGVAFPQFRFFGPFICEGKNKRRCVALTFDDGPDARSTPALLELLREARVRATFFCVGKRVEESPDLTAQIAREGHLVENHSFAHDKLTNFFSVARLHTELGRAQSVIHAATGKTPKLFRPPMGLSNPRIFRAARQLNLAVIGWTARGIDTQIKDPERVVARIKKRLKPGAIILLHDGNIPPERLLPTVKMLLDTLRALDYEVIRLDELLR